MNKRIAIYTASAIIAGFTIMMLPLALETGPPTYTPRPAFTAETRSKNSEAPDLGGNQPLLQGLVSKPMNILPAGIVFFAGLAVAIGVYAMLRKKSG